MTLCVHFSKDKKATTADCHGCKNEVVEKCRKNGILEEKHDDFRIIPVDRIAPW